MRDRRGGRQMARRRGQARPSARRLRLALLYIEGQLFPQDFSRAAELLAPPPRPAIRKRNMRSAPSTRRAAACRRTCQAARLLGACRARRQYRRRGRIRHRAVQRRRRRQERRPPPPCSARRRCTATRSPRTGWRASWPGAAARQSGRGHQMAPDLQGRRRNDPDARDCVDKRRRPRAAAGREGAAAET